MRIFYESRREENKRRQLARFFLLPSNKRYIITPLPGIFFSNMRLRSDNHPHQPLYSLSFLNSIGTGKICFYCDIFYITIQPSTTAQSVQQNNLFSIRNFSMFMCLQSSFMYYVLCIILILCPIAEVT